jgi:hypothetical protein
MTFYEYYISGSEGEFQFELGNNEISLCKRPKYRDGCITEYFIAEVTMHMCEEVAEDSTGRPSLIVTSACNV